MQDASVMGTFLIEGTGFHLSGVQWKEFPLPGQAPSSADPARALDLQAQHEKNVEATKFDFIRFWGVSRGLTLGKGDVLRLEPLGERWLVDEFLGPEMTARVKVLPEA